MKAFIITPKDHTHEFLIFGDNTPEEAIKFAQKENPFLNYKSECEAVPTNGIKGYWIAHFSGNEFAGRLGITFKPTHLEEAIQYAESKEFIKGSKISHFERQKTNK